MRFGVARDQSCEVSQVLVIYTKKVQNSISANHKKIKYDNC